MAVAATVITEAEYIKEFLDLEYRRHGH